MKKAAVLGASGFIGSHLVARLRASGYEVDVPERASRRLLGMEGGTVFYCIGLTADFRCRPFATMDAHVVALNEILEHSAFNQLIYLSSTRLYAGCDDAREDQELCALPSRTDDLYNLSKMAGESLALASGRRCSVARLSNVIGPGMGATNFLGSVVDEAKRTRAVRFNTAPSSGKDYIWITDAVDGLIAIAERGSAPIYNLAAGATISHHAVAGLLVELGIEVSFAEAAPASSFPPIRIELLDHDTGFRPEAVLPKLESWLEKELSI